MNLQPWLDGDEVGQEQEGYLEGQLHCKQGWCTDWCADGCIDTPFSRGYRRGWDDTKAAGLHGTEPPLRDRTLQPWSNEYL